LPGVSCCATQRSNEESTFLMRSFDAWYESWTTSTVVSRTSSSPDMHSILVIYFCRSLRMHENLSPIKRKFDNDSDSPQLARKSRPHSQAVLSVNEGKGGYTSLWDFCLFFTSGFIEEPIIPGLPEPPV